MSSVKFSLCFATIFLLKIKGLTAGSCYEKIDNDGQCRALVANDVSKEECCSSLGVAFNEEISDESIFMLAAGIRKETCKSCRETCDHANCGAGKRCIMKKGFPKCVCAPNCKANKNQNANSASEIAVIQMPDARLLKRNDKRLTPIEMQSDEPTLIIANFNRRQGDKKANHKAKEALSYTPLVDREQIQVHQMNVSNETDHANTIGMKIRSGFFNDQSLKAGALHDDGFYVGNLPKFSHYNPICGNDGRTYKNSCQLKKRACRQENKLLEVAYKGHCQSACKFIKCSNGKTCIEDQNSAPQCITCPRCSNNNRNLTSQVISKMVCGADGITYRNLCVLRQKSCKLGKSIPLLHRGPCSEVLSCNQCSKVQKCLPDLMTHQPKCLACNYKCPRKRRPATGKRSDQVCGKNNITYHSWCHLMKDSCNTGYYIEMKHEGPCLSS